jgi:hypothetical protein
MIMAYQIISVRSNVFVPFQEAAKVTYTASCLAIKYNMVLVINMGDLVPCNSTFEPNCPSDGHWMYNTQVAFDENGQVSIQY